MTSHDRYLIYEMLGRHVTAPHPKTLRRVRGPCEHVCRDIFDGLVEVTLSGQLYAYMEPTLIVLDGEHLVFVYGNDSPFNGSDEELFRAIRSGEHWGETPEEVMVDTAPTMTKEVSFKMGPRVIPSSRCRRCRR